LFEEKAQVVKVVKAVGVVGETWNDRDALTICGHHVTETFLRHFQLDAWVATLSEPKWHGLCAHGWLVVE